MAFLLSDLKKKKVGAIVRELNYNDILTLTMQVSDDKQYVSAVSKLQQPEQDLTKNALSKANNTGDSLSVGMAMLYVIGEYLITEWDVEVSEGEVAPINGDNFINLCESIDDDAEFTKFISKNFQEMSKEFADQKKQGEMTKKKPSHATSGKKSSQD